MKAKIQKGGLQLRKRLKWGSAPKILSAEIKEGDLSILCRFYYDPACPNLKINAYMLGDGLWTRTTSDVQGSEEQYLLRNEFRVIIPSCVPGTYKVEARQTILDQCKLSYNSVIVED